MSRKSKNKSKSARSNRRSQPSQSERLPESKALPARSGARLWLFRMIVAVLAPMVFIVLLEIGLRQVDYGYATDFFQSSSDGTQWIENPKFAWQFYSPNSNLKPHPFSLSKIKKPGSIRIFALGESATLGTPESAYGFVRILERMLAIRFPDQEFEVVNAAMPGINSHLIRSIAQDCIARDADLFLIYMGNNELVGLHAPGSDSRGLTEHLTLLRLIQTVRSSRMGQLLSPMMQFLAPEQPKGEQDMTFFRNHRLAASHPGRQAVYDNFRANLGSILNAAQGAGVKTILSTVAVNLRQCPPLGSLHAAGLGSSDLAAWEQAFSEGVRLQSAGAFDPALASYKRAELIDGVYAELIFRMAQCFEGKADLTEAKRYYSRARDLDALPFRTDSQLNTVVRELGQDSKGTQVALLESDRRLAMFPEVPDGLLGLETFYEHVHYRFSGDYRLASLFFGEIQGLFETRLGLKEGERLEAPSLEECAAALAYNRVNEGLLESAILDMTSHAPFLDQIDHAARVASFREGLQQRYGSLNTEDVATAFQVYQKAMDQYPNDWNLAYLLARLHFTFHNFEAARDHLKRATELMPHVLEVRLGYTRALIETKQFDEAFRQIEIMKALEPDSEEVAAAFSTAKARQAANR